MKLDLNKPWIMKLVNQNSTVNGCSFIRGVILRTIWKAFLWVAGVSLGSLLIAALIGGAYMWFHEPSYFYTEFPNRMTYFGTDAVAYTWALLSFIGGLIWGVVAILGTFFGAIWAIVNLLAATDGPIRNAASKTWDAITPPQEFREAVSAWYHKFCPQIEFILPTGYEGYVVGARVAQLSHNWDDEGEELEAVWMAGAIQSVEVKGGYLNLYILWDATRDMLINHYAEPSTIDQYDTPELAQKGLERMLKVRLDERRLWFTNDNSDFKLVEEISSPA